MKLSTIIHAIVRPIINVQNWNDAIIVRFLGYDGAGFMLCTPDCAHYGVPMRATAGRIGDLKFSWWGRDTMVHHAPEAS